MFLREIQNPRDLKILSVQELELICAEIRHEIISTSLKNGGHIGASLGAVEIAVALHRIFESPKDSILWDVGHQAYAHKLLTGRLDRFSTIRLTDGLAPFLSRLESEHDVYGAGHSSTSISAAMGFAYQNPDWTIAVIGDGALTAGLTFEALNHLHQLQQNSLGPMLIVLNDNQMSISENIGAIPHILSQGYTGSFFEHFGVETIGPVNGHDLNQLLATLNGIRESKPKAPVLLHVHTQKGKGYGPAEIRPSTFHGVGPAKTSTGKMEKLPAPHEPKTYTWSEVLCRSLIDLAKRDPKVVVITPAMSEGSGLVPFANRYPDRLFDVGIAEAHAVTFAAGLAAKGWKPVVAIYSTFMQRAYDALIHDVALQGLPVVFAVDRAGLVGSDGPTHHGSFDLAYTLPVPGLDILAPETDLDLHEMLKNALTSEVPTFIRYPRGTCPAGDETQAAGIGWERVRTAAVTEAAATLAPEYMTPKKILLAVGSAGTKARKVLQIVGRDSLELIILRQVKPLPSELLTFLRERSPGSPIFVLEEGTRRGGVGEVLLQSLETPARVISLGYPDEFVSHGSVADLEARLGLDVDSIVRRIQAESP